MAEREMIWRMGSGSVSVERGRRGRSDSVPAAFLGGVPPWKWVFPSYRCIGARATMSQAMETRLHALQSRERRDGWPVPDTGLKPATPCGRRRSGKGRLHPVETPLACSLPRAEQGHATASEDVDIPYPQYYCVSESHCEERGERSSAAVFIRFYKGE